MSLVRIHICVFMFNLSLARFVFVISIQTYAFIQCNYLRVEPVNGISRGIECFEKIIRTPLNKIFDMVELPCSFVLCTVLDHAPTQHCHGKRRRKVELNRVPRVIVPTTEICHVKLPIVQA